VKVVTGQEVSDTFGLKFLFCCWKAGGQWPYTTACTCSD